MIPIQSLSESPHRLSSSLSLSIPTIVGGSPSPSGTPRLSHLREGSKSPVKRMSDFNFRRAQQRRMTPEREIEFSPRSFLQNECQRRCDDALPSEMIKKGNVRVISQQTFLQCILEKRQMKVIDCRYSYEYKEGHFDGAINIWHEGLLFDQFPVDNRSHQCDDILLFYCEYSGGRGPELATRLREVDKQMSLYGELIYNNIYVIEKGVIGLFEFIPQHCVGYHLPMRKEGWESERERDCRIANNYKQMMNRKYNVTRSNSFTQIEQSMGLFVDLKHYEIQKRKN